MTTTDYFGICDFINLGSPTPPTADEPVAHHIYHGGPHPRSVWFQIVGWGPSQQSPTLSCARLASVRHPQTGSELSTLLHVNAFAAGPNESCIATGVGEYDHVHDLLRRFQRRQLPPPIMRVEVFAHPVAFLPIPESPRDRTLVLSGRQSGSAGLFPAIVAQLEADLDRVYSITAAIGDADDGKARILIEYPPDQRANVRAFVEHVNQVAKEYGYVGHIHEETPGNFISLLLRRIG
ncbi:MAG: hypothetical protein KDI19_13750 [Pseudomonadales bacterium]|nr:hypothetical protein [Pseudomonadales bacterium]